MLSSKHNNREGMLSSKHNNREGMLSDGINILIFFYSISSFKVFFGNLFINKFLYGLAAAVPLLLHSNKTTKLPPAGTAVCLYVLNKRSKLYLPFICYHYYLPKKTQ